MLGVFQNILERLRDECLAQGYEMLLEADVSGWLFHLLLTQPGINSHQIHSDTRVCSASGRYDIVVGPVETGPKGRPCIQPRLVVEIKLFPRMGFTDQQHRVHYLQIIDRDLPKLGSLDSSIELSTAFVVDGTEYLGGTYQGWNRREYLLKKRDEVAADAHVFIVRRVNDNWQVEHASP